MRVEDDVEEDEYELTHLEPSGVMSFFGTKAI